MKCLPNDLILFILELKGGLEHRDLQRKLLQEYFQKILWISSICGYQEVFIPNKDFIYELLVCNKNNLKIKS